MTRKEIELILIEGLFQTPETRVDYYLLKAIENNCTYFNFCRALVEAYKRLNDYVNSNEPNSWAESKDGTKEPVKKTINLLHFTNGLFKGTLDDENITSLLPGLQELTIQVKSDIEKEALQLNKSKSNHTNKKTGFQSSLTDEQIERLFDQLKNTYIDSTTDLNHFKAIFKTATLPADFLPIKRTKRFTGTLLAYFVSELFQRENQSDYWHIALNCFQRANNLKQSLTNAFNYNPNGKPKGYEEIDTILKIIYTPLQ